MQPGLIKGYQFDAGSAQALAAIAHRTYLSCDAVKDLKPLSEKRKPREWAPRIWEGSDYFAWLRLLWTNRFDVHLPYTYIAAIVSCVTFTHMVLRWIQEGLYGESIRRTRIKLAPIFVIGHWRTGTTLLHELLIRDDQFTYPDTFACLMPHHIVLSEHFFKTYCRWMMPERRPMDNMPFGWDRPQEDEFALALLGQPSTYTDIAFPNRPPVFPGSLDLSRLTSQQLRTWKRTFLLFLKTLTFRDPRRLVLKSPPHTARIPILHEMFPDARFVHILRDPYVVFPSTVNLWKSLARKHGLQKPDDRGWREKVFQEFRLIHERLEEARPTVPVNCFHELRYEDLVRSPVVEIQKLYDALKLQGFERVRPRLEDYQRAHASYETNKYQLSDSDRQEITRRWGDIIVRQGYSLRE